MPHILAQVKAHPPVLQFYGVTMEFIAQSPRDRDCQGQGSLSTCPFQTQMTHYTGYDVQPPISFKWSRW